MIYSYILCYVYYIHIAHKYNIPFSFSNSMSPTCPLVYIHRYTTYNTIFANISVFLNEHISLICTHIYIHNSIYLSILSFFFCGPACNFSLKLPRPLKRQAGWRSGHWAGFDWSKRWAVGEIGWATAVGGWMVRLGRCGLADFFGPWIFFFLGGIFLGQNRWFVAFFEIGRLLFVGVYCK